MQRQTPMGEVQTPDPGKAQNSETEGTSLQTWAQAEVRSRAGLRAEHGVVGPDLQPPSSGWLPKHRQSRLLPTRVFLWGN